MTRNRTAIASRERNGLWARIALTMMALTLAPALLLATAPVAGGEARAASSKYNSGYRVTPGTWQPLRKRARGRKTHFVEFRARNAQSYGHTSVVFGKLRRGRVPKNRKGVLLKGWYEIAGLAPASNSGAVYMIGHLVPLPATTGWTDGDDEDEYMTANFTIKLTRKEYLQVRRLIKKRQRASKFWNATVYACVHFTADVAKDIGLKVPRGFYLPKSWVTKLKRINRGV